MRGLPLKMNQRRIFCVGKYISSGAIYDTPDLTIGRMDDLLEKFSIKTTRPEAMENNFHALLWCVYEGEQGYSKQERSLMSLELEYAYRHDVPPELLSGFLYQSTSRRDLEETDR